MPKNGRLILSIKKKKKETKTASGIYMPNADDKEYYENEGIIMATCDAAEYPLESKVLFDIKATVYPVPGTEDIAINERDVVAIDILPRSANAVDIVSVAETTEVLEKREHLCLSCKHSYPECMSLNSWVQQTTVGYNVRICESYEVTDE